MYIIDPLTLTVGNTLMVTSTKGEDDIGFRFPLSELNTSLDCSTEMLFPGGREWHQPGGRCDTGS